MSCVDSFRARRLSAALRSCGFISVALAATVLSLPMGAQESRATIAGRVTDASDAVVVGANIVAANVNILAREQIHYLGEQIFEEGKCFLFRAEYIIKYAPKFLHFKWTSGA